MESPHVPREDHVSSGKSVSTAIPSSAAGPKGSIRLNSCLYCSILIGSEFSTWPVTSPGMAAMAALCSGEKAPILASQENPKHQGDPENSREFWALRRPRTQGSRQHIIGAPVRELTYQESLRVFLSECFSKGSAGGPSGLHFPWFRFLENPHH